MANRNGTPRNPREMGGQRQKVQDGPATDYQEWIDQGDVLGLLDWLRSRSVLRLPTSAMDDLAKAIRRLERQDIESLVDVAYSEIIGLITTLLVRYQIHIERRLAECDSYGGDPVHMPQDLIDEDWLGRIERISKFLMEVTSTRERVRHLARLNKNGTKSPIKFNVFADSPMDSASGPPRNGKATPPNGRFRCPESRIEFP